MGRNLSNISSIATEKTNKTGVLDPILEIQPDDGTKLIIENMVQRGDEMGLPIFAKLRSGANTQLPQDTTIALQFERPTDDNASTVSEPEENIRTYRRLSIKEQQKEEYVDAVKHMLKAAALQVDDVDKLYVSINSSAQIDWNNSELNFDEKAVREV